MNGELRLPSLIRQGTPLYDRISPAFDTVYTLLQDRPPFFEFAAKAGMLAAFGALAESGEAASAAQRHGAAAASIKKAIQHIQENYRAPLTIDRLAEIAGMSEGHFCRVFKQYTLKTPVQFINGVRLTHAADQLANTNKRVLDIAMDCGFNSVSYFIEVFRESFGITPSKYRKG